MSDDELTTVRLVLREALVSTDRRAAVIERFSRGHLPLVLSAVVEGTAAGAISARHPVPVMAIALMALAIAPQIVRRIVAGKQPESRALLPDAEAFAAALADIAWRGVQAEQSATSGS